MSLGCWSYPKRLGSAKPANTSDTLVYTAPAGMAAVLDGVMVANNSGAAVDFRLFVDESGTPTYDTTTATHYDVSVPANTTSRVPLGYPVPTGTKVAVRSATGDALRFILIGRERKA